MGGVLEEKDRQNILRALRSYLLRKQFRFGRCTDKIQLNRNHDVLRARYFRILKNNRALAVNEQRREVFVDESYLHHHHSSFGDSLWDPFDTNDVLKRMQHKGARYCICAAIQRQSIQSEDELCGLVPNTVWIFAPKTSGEQSCDYHKNFKAQNFKNWWKTQLLPNLSETSIICIDNATYHKALPEDTPKPYKMKKEEVMRAFQERKIPFDIEIKSIELKRLLKEWIVNNVVPELVFISAAEAHIVVCTPPYHSDLRPIELVWALIKSNVARRYDEKTIMKDVYQRLSTEFNFLMSEEGKKYNQRDHEQDRVYSIAFLVRN